MTKIYTNCSFLRVILLIFTMMPLAVFAGSPGSPDPVTQPTDPDSLINQNQPLGHLECNIHTDTNCVTHMMGLEAWIDYTFTGVSIPVTVPWSTGQTAHKIFVTPPGTWSWDVTGIGCEPVHQNNFITIDGSFFLGPLEIEGPPAICPFEIVELTVNTNGYDEFTDFDWNPDGDDLSPYTIQAPGTYTLTVWDAFSCPFMDSYTIPLVPPFVPQITGPVRICPEADTAVLVVQGTYFGYEWSNGDSGNPLIVTEPGLYEVTATDQYGCTGVGTYGVQSGGVDPFSVTVTSTTLCPGQLDTLRVLGGFSSYVWSNGHNGITNIVNMAGTYTVTVTNIYGCTGTASTTVTPLVPPNVAVSNTPLCPGGMATLAVTNGPFTNYTWSTGQNTSAITINNPGTYTVTVSGGGICATSTNIVVPLAAVPTTVIANPDLLTCMVTTDTLDGSGSSSGPNFPFVWTTQGGNFLADQNTLNPVVNQPGTYILSITNQTTGCITRDTVVVPQNITPPGANAGPPATLNCTFTTLNIGPVPPPGNPNFVPNWTTIGGNIQTGGGTWSPTVNQPGTYILTVTNTVNQCTSTASVLIPQDITDPVANIAPPSLLTCTQSTVTLNNTGSSTGPQFSYQWSTTNGTLNGPVNGPSATAASIGNYVLTVTNTLNGCTSTASTIVDADINIPMVSAIPPNILTCDVTSVLIDASASSNGSTYVYNWTGGTIQSGGTTLTPTVTAPGVYTLSLVNTANNCSATLGVTVQQNITPPPVNAGPNNTLNCTAPTLVLDGSASASGPGYSYIWTTTGGTILSGDTTLAPTIGSPGIYTLQVTDLNNGCTATSTTQVLEDNNAPQAIIAPPAILNCITQQVQINATQSTYGSQYICVWGGPAIAQGGTTPTPTITAPGTYCITITNTANGCTDVDCTTVGLDITPPPVDAGNDVLLNCYTPAGTIGSATNPSGGTFILSWTTADGNFVSATNGPTANIDQLGTYQLVVTNTANGCTSVDQVQVTEDFAPPLADAGNTFELTCVVTSTVLGGTGSTGPIFEYQWTTSGTGQILSGDQTLNPTIDNPGTYQLLVTNTQNGCTSTDQVVITESALVPVAAAGLPQTLTCSVTSLNLNGAGTATGPGIIYAWSTIGGTISGGGTTLTPTITDPGTYILTVTNTNNNCTNTASVVIDENVQNPVVDAGPNNTLTCAITQLPLQATITSSSSANISYNWTTMGGQIQSGPTTSNPTINAPGTYLVTVTDAINGCTGTDQLVINQDITPPTALIGNPATLTCTTTQTPLSTTGSSTGANFVYSWTTTGTGHFVTTQDPLAPIVDNPGVYTLLITNNINGCTQTTTVTVPEDVVLPNAEAGQTVGLDCDTPTNSLNGTGSSTGANFLYQWSTTNGQIVSGGTSLSPVIGDPGTYTILVTNNINGCTQTDNVVVTEDVNPPVFAIGTPQVLTCTVLTVPVNASGSGFGNAPLFVWSTSGGNIVSGGNTLNATVNEPGTYLLTATNTGNGCTNTASILVTENTTPPNVQVQPAPLLTCSVTDFPLQSTASPQTTVVWSTTTGHIVSGHTTLNPVVDEPGLYAVVVTSTVNGCTSTNQVTVQQETNLPTGIQFKLDQPLCNGTPGLLEVEQVVGGVGPYTYSIDGGQSFFTFQEFGDLTPGAYSLVIQDANGCEIDQPITVIPPLQPLVTSPPEFSIQLGQDQEIKALVPPPFPLSSIEQVIWEPMEGLTFEGNSIQQLLNPTAMPFITTEYKVTIITPEGCKSEAVTLIRVNRDVDIYAPNVIWPEDPDGDNSTFQLFGRDESIANIHRLQIFDRWGTLVFENKDFSPNDLSNGWDGMYRGEPVNPAVFVWYAELTLIDGRNLLLKGDVTVVR